MVKSSQTTNPGGATLLRFNTTVLVVVLAGLAGCGSAGSALYPVSGKVMFTDGRVVPSGLVEFTPDDGTPPARGKIESDGRFMLTTGTQAGAVSGTHKIAVIQVNAGEQAPPPGHKHKGFTVDRKYSRTETSGLTRQVRPDQANVFEIEVDASR